MVTPREVLDVIEHAIDDSDAVTQSVDFLSHEADMSGADSNVGVPLVQLQPVDEIRVNPHNTDLVGYLTDDDGNRTGKVYHSEYELTIQIDVWTVDDPSRQDGSEEAHRLGEEVKEALYEYSSYGMEQQFEYEDGSAVDEIWRFVIGDGGPADDLTQSPTVRRWRQDVEVWAYEEFTLTAEGQPAGTINNPTTFEDSNNDGQLETV